MDLVSVIVPTYNREDTIVRALDSILSQTYKNIEIVVVDDGSTDNTSNVLLGFKNHIRYYYNNNRGVSFSRNYGARLSTGKYLSFLDSDDYFKSDNIEKKINKIHEIGKSSLVLSDCCFVDVDGKRSFDFLRENYCSDNMYTHSDVLMNPWLIPSSMLLDKHSFMSLGGFREDLVTAEDLDFFIRYSSNYPVYTLGEILVFCTKGTGGLSELHESYDDYVNVYKSYFKSNPLEIQTRKRLLHNIYIKSANGKIWKCKYLDALRYLILSYLYCHNVETVKKSIRTSSKLLYGLVRNI